MIKEIKKYIIRSIFLAIFLAIFSVNYGHEIPLNHMFVKTGEQEIHVQLFINLFDLNDYKSFDLNNDGILDDYEFEQGSAIINEMLESAIKFYIDGERLDVISTGSSLDQIHHLLFRVHYGLKKIKNKKLKINLELDKICSRAQTTEVTFDNNENVEYAQLQGRENTVTFLFINETQKKLVFNLSTYNKLTRYVAFSFITLIAIVVIFNIRK